MSVMTSREEHELDAEDTRSLQEDARREHEARQATDRRVRSLLLSEPQKEVILKAVKDAERRAKKLGYRWSTLLETVDLASIGRVAVMEIQQRYDASKGSFGGYAARRAFGAMMDAIRKQVTYRHHVRAYCQACEFLTGQVDPGNVVLDSDETTRWRLSAFADQVVMASALGAMVELSSASGQWALEEQEAHAHLLRLMFEEKDKLPEHERRIVERHYLEGVKLEDVGLELGMTFAVVRRLNGQILLKLADALRARKMKNASGEEYLPGEREAELAREKEREGGSVVRLRRRKHGP